MRRSRAALEPLVLGAIVAVVAALDHQSPSAAAPPAGHARSAALAAVAPPDRFGVNGQVLFWQLPQSSWAQQLRVMRQDGIRIVRADAFWDNVEPYAPSGGVHRYYWSHLDAIVAALADQGLRWLPIVDYSAPWAASRRNALGQPLLYSPPSDDNAFAGYAQALVRRYGPGGEFWRQHPGLAPVPVTALEIWNEENGPVFWVPREDPGAYASLYEATRAAVHAADASIEVLVGGLANPSAPFLQGMIDALGGDTSRIDAVAIHPYAGTPDQMLPDVIDTRTVLDQHGGIDVPLDVTEFGWAVHAPSSGGPWVTDQQRASYLQQFTQTIARSDCSVERILPHTWVSLETNAANPEDWYGLVQPNGTPTLGASAYGATLAQLDATPVATPATAVCQRQFAVRADATQLAPIRVRAPATRRRKRRGSHRAPHTKSAKAARSRTRRARIVLWGACARATLLSGATPVDAATVSFVLRPTGGTRAPRGALSLQRPSDAHGSVRVCWRSSTPGSGTVTISAQRADFSDAPTAQAELIWGPTGATGPTGARQR